MVSPFLSHLFLNLIKSYFVKEEKKNSLRNCLYYSPEFVSFNFKSHFPGDWNRNNKKNSSTCKMHRRGSDRSMREKKKKKKRERKREREREILSTVHQTRCQMPRARSTYSPSCYFLFHCPRVALNILLINVPIMVLSHEFYSLSLSLSLSLENILSAQCENAYSPVRVWLPDKKRNQSGKIRSIYYVPTLSERERRERGK